MQYDDINFNDLYIKHKKRTSFKAKSKEAWDKKAVFMNEKVHKSIYNDEFLEHLNLDGIDSILDVGCGVGNLSLKLAKKVKLVYSLDYSPGMLELLQKNAKEQNLDNITTINKSWYDLWDDIPNSDLVIASRSMEVKDMKEALLKLHNKANKRVVISYKKGGSFVSDEILQALQKKIVKKPDYIYIINILYQMGINASLTFVNSEGRNVIYTSLDKFIESVTWSLGELTNDELQRLTKYYNNLDLTKKSKKDFVQWAVISWDKN